MKQLLNRLAYGEHTIRVYRKNRNAEEKRLKEFSIEINSRMDKLYDASNIEEKRIMRDVYELFLLRKMDLVCDHQQPNSNIDCALCDMNILPIIATQTMQLCYECDETVEEIWPRFAKYQVKYLTHMLLKEVVGCDVSVAILRHISYRPALILRYDGYPDQYHH